MAKNTGVIQLQGTIGNMVFNRNGTVGQKPAGRAQSAVRTLENNAEFVTAVKAAKLLNDPMRPYIRDAKDARSFNRLSALMSKIIKKDSVNPRGQRGVLDDELMDLKGFDFNAQSGLKSTLFAEITPTFTRASGEAILSVDAHSALAAIAPPQGGTHYKFFGVALEVDFATGETVVKSAESPEISLTDAVVPLTDLAVDVTPASTKTVIFGVGIKFYQKVNAVSYPLQNGAFNAFQLVEVELP